MKASGKLLKVWRRIEASEELLTNVNGSRKF